MGGPFMELADWVDQASAMTIPDLTEGLKYVARMDVMMEVSRQD
mgnify:FL=1